MSGGPALGDRPMLIGGERQGAATGETLEAVNPATGEVLGRFPRGQAEDVDRAVRAAADAFPGWKATTATDRAACLNRLADLVLESSDELAALDVADNGSPVKEMRNDAHIAVAQMRYFAGLALQLRGETIPTGHDRLNYTLREPFGVVGRIIPFNHPLMFAASKIAAPLIAGNTVVLKPSEHTSLSALRLAELIVEAFPPGVVNVVTGLGAEAGDALVAHPLVRRLAFIGSVAIGLSIQRRAAESVVKAVTLELGGKNPIAIFPDADLEAAVDGALRGMNFTWQGQSCGSTSRLLVHRSLHGQFVELLAARLEGLRSGPPGEEDTDTGAIVHQAQYEKVVSYLALGREEGARVVVGGGPVAVEGHREAFIRPTLFDEVRPGSRLAQEEIFGPVLAVLPFRDYAEAIEIANSVSYGLTASVFTDDLAIAHRFARDVEAGYVWVNDSSRHFLGAPYGGVKNSGVGREEGIEEMQSYAEPKNVNVRFD
ncbi:MAG: aldehyde dehydrogenase family protein [Solirubrobacterales bacterium]